MFTKHVDASLLLFSGLLAFSPALAEEVKTLPSTHNAPMSTRTSIVMQNLLSQMGMSLPDDDKDMPKPTPAPQPEPQPTPKPKPAPEPEPKPTPKPEPKPEPEPEEDNFFGDDEDDDFFSSDLSYEEMKQKMKKDYADTKAAWQKEYDETVAKWAKAKKQYVKNIDKHKSATIDPKVLEQPSLTVNSPVMLSTVSNPLEGMRPGEFYVIPNAMEVPIKNQAYRGTCAAFAGVRAMETVLIQHNVFADLSEQHFYWLSKPECQNSPCSSEKAGSRYEVGLENSKRNSLGVLSESNCPYVVNVQSTNETQTPLPGCKGEPGIRSGEIRLNISPDQAIQEIRANHPVMAGVRLNDNFYEDTIITVANIGKYSGKTDSHAGGHAILFVGYVRLPSSMNEGDYCMVTANSWGDGWGAGGYACITENWLRRNKISFESLSSVEITPEYEKHML